MQSTVEQRHYKFCRKKKDTIVSDIFIIQLKRNFMWAKEQGAIIQWYYMFVNQGARDLKCGQTHANIENETIL